MTSGDVRAEVWEGLGGTALAARWGVPAVHLFRSVGSTNDVARQLANEAVAPGTVCLAESQTAGRGRAGRGWDSPAGKGIWLSMIVPPPPAGGDAGVLPLRAGLAAALALEPFTPAGRIGVKWPNDLILDGAKLGGVLCEGIWSGDLPGHVVVGLGINVSQTRDDLPEPIRDQATSIAIASGAAPDRLVVGDSLIRSLVRHLVTDPLTEVSLAAGLAERDVLVGRRVTVQTTESGEPRVEGVAMGIAPDGALQLRLDGDRSAPGDAGEGRVIGIRAGTVRLVGQAVPSPQRG